MADNIVEKFLEHYEDIENRFSDIWKNEKIKIEEFRSKFPIETIKNMHWQDYVEGLSNHDGSTKQTFSWWVEWNLVHSGRINGCPGGAKALFGMFWSKNRNKLEWKKKFDTKNHNPDEVFELIKSELIKLIQAIQSRNIDAIKKSELAPSFINKITYLYDADNWIPINSEDKIDMALRMLDIEFSKNEHFIDKRVKLFNFYKRVKTDSMNTFFFMNCLFDKYLTDSGKETSFVNQPIDNNQYRLQFCKSTDDLSGNETGEYHGPNGLNIKAEETKEWVGNKAEEIVLNFLKDKNNSFLGEKIVGDVSDFTKTPSKHFDFSFQTETGKTFYIEVKGRKSKQKFALFEMSKWEYDFMNEHKDTYFVLYIDDILNNKTIYCISAKDVSVFPIKYRAKLRLNFN